MASHEEMFREALKSDDKFMSLRQVVITLRSSGVDKQTLLSNLEAFRKIVVTEVDEDVVLEVMDCLVGWCSSHMVIE